MLDIFCGNGAVSRAIHEHKLPVSAVWGFDGSPKMIAECECWRQQAKPADSQFFSHPDELCRSNAPRFQIVTINMGIFQLDLRARHFLFQRLLRHLSDDCVVIFTTYAADFEFSTEVAGQCLDVNADNPFKERFFGICRSLQYEPPCEYAEAIAPVFPKDNYHSLSCFFELYGFQLEPKPKDLSVLPIERTWEDRIAFTSIPVISRKIFGEEMPDSVWKRMSEVDGGPDTTYGTVMRARRLRRNWNPGHCFSHAGVDFSKSLPIRLATALVIRSQRGRVLFAKRGEGARDFRGEWSLPSCFAQERKGGLEGNVRKSMDEHLGIRLNKINMLQPLSIRFSQRRGDGSDWILAMCLFEGALEDEEVTPRTDKYSEVIWKDAWSFLTRLERTSMGDCTKSYSDFLRVIQGKDELLRGAPNAQHVGG